MLNTHFNELSNNNISNYPIVNKGSDWIPRNWHDLIKNDEKEISEKAKRVMNIIKYLLTKRCYKNYKYNYFANILKRSKDQVKRYFDELKDAGICTVEFRRSLTRDDGKKYRDALNFQVTEKGIKELGLQGKVAPHSFAAKMHRASVNRTKTEQEQNNSPDTTLKNSFCSFVTLDIPRKEEEVHCVDIGLSTGDNSDNLQSKKNTKIEIKSELPIEKQVELLKELQSNTTLPPTITNLMKSDTYKAPEAYTWDYEQYRKDHGMSEIKEEIPAAIVSKGLDILKNLKVIKQEEVAAPPATSAEIAHVAQSQTNEPITNLGILDQFPNNSQKNDAIPILAVPDTVKPVEKQVTKQPHKPATPSINANVRFEPHSEFRPNFLRNYRFNRQQFDEIRILTGDLELTDDEIIGTIQRIVTDKPDTQIWGGRKAFANFMVKVLNNQRKAALEDDSESIADIERKKYEKALYNFENNIIEWF